MTDVLTTFLTPALTGIVLGALFLFVRRANDKKLLESEGRNHVIVRLPKAFVWIGVIGVLFVCSPPSCRFNPRRLREEDLLPPAT
ncbi:MAG TPA: hypothetical protein DEB24_04350 [Coriobacteriia bacterium]|nr:hypothetical protein [Coriobacteriia bacterium]